MSENRPATLRTTQEAVIAYEGGKMGVAAVPGSGKTFTLSHLAAALVERLLDESHTDERLDQEVLIVTFTNPAVNAFRSRIARLIEQERGLLPYIGYRVRTLHGLAHDIVRMRPGLVGLSEGFEILDERVTSAIIRDLAEHWVRTEGEQLIPYVDMSLVEDEQQVGNIIRRYAADLIESLAYEVIRLGKDHRRDPAELAAALEAAGFDLPLARIGINLYASYQRSLSYRGAVDFDDLVRLAMEAIQADPEFLLRLQRRWPYILEDEAQDSSKLQNEMLGYLAGAENKKLKLPPAGANWVRVGDPNQAIYTTFTTADSNFLIEFLSQKDTQPRELPVSGRSAPDIIRLANYLVRWAGSSPLLPERLRGAFRALDIRPTEAGDPQANPTESFIYLDWDPEHNITPEAEIDRVVKSIANWLPDHPDWTVAVLVPENSRGFKMTEALKERDIPYEELLRSTSATRDAASRLEAAFDFLADPTDNRRLARLYNDVWWPKVTADPEDPEDQTLRDGVVRLLRQVKATENFLWPGPEGDWLESQRERLPEGVADDLDAFRTQTRLWLHASTLPVDQLTITISQDLFSEQVDLALGHKIAVVLGSIAANNPDYRLPELAGELRVIARNERRFLGFDDAVDGYEPRPGVVTVATMHAAKGLEWDRVYLMAVNNYSFPAAQPGDSYISERWFIRDELNIQAEAHRQIELLIDGHANEYTEGEASREARIDYAAERMRLLYVGITRARKDLIITWNMGRFWEQGRRNSASAALIALTDFWKKEIKGE